MIISFFTLATLLVISALSRSSSLELPGPLYSYFSKRSRALVKRIFPEKETFDGISIQQRVRSWSSRHRTAQLLADLIDEDGAGAWPPRANHDYSTWPAPLRGYPAVYHKLEHLLSTATPSLDEQVNRDRIDSFRSEFRKQLRENVDLDQVRPWLKAGEAGRWNIFSRDTYNAFWCCVAMCRHAYR